MTFHQIHPRNHYLCHRPSSLGYTGYYHRWRSLRDRKWVLGWGSSAHHCHPHSHFVCHSASVRECTVPRGHTQMLKVHRKYLQQKRIGHKDICFYSLLNEILPCKGPFLLLFQWERYTKCASLFSNYHMPGTFLSVYIFFFSLNPHKNTVRYI